MTCPLMQGRLANFRNVLEFKNGNLLAFRIYKDGYHLVDMPLFKFSYLYFHNSKRTSLLWLFNPPDKS